MSNFMKCEVDFELIPLNHSITDEVFFHWLLCLAFRISLLIVSKCLLLILPMFDLHGFKSLHEILFGKFGLWSFIVIKAGLSFNTWTLSNKFNFSVISKASLLTVSTWVLLLFLYVLVTLSDNNFSYSSGITPYILAVLSAWTNTFSDFLIDLISDMILSCNELFTFLNSTFFTIL